MMRAEMELRSANRSQARAEGVREGIRRVKILLELNKVEVQPDVAEMIFGEPMNYDETTWAERWQGVAKGAEEKLKGDPRFEALMRKYPK